MAKLVHITLSDRGWILEKCARVLGGSLSYLSFDLDQDRAAPIQYYVTYSRFAEKRNAVEMAFFTHQEQDPITKQRFIDVGRSVDVAVCMSQTYERVLREAGAGVVEVISPGVDLEAFQPKIKIGIVGRTYHTGRKGEAIVAKVMDLPGIEWHFTGEGWPGPTRMIREDRLPDFYRSMDYILVPALYEGGPMCLLEALAVGVPVIAPPVGFVPELPHIEFRTGDVSDLRRVLSELVSEKQALRQAVLDRGWDAWTEKHDRLFHRLARSAGITTAPEQFATAAPVAERQSVEVDDLPHIYLDVTTSAFSSGNFGGTFRVENAIVREFIRRIPQKLTLVVWNNVDRRYLIVPTGAYGGEEFFTIAARGFAGADWRTLSDPPAGAVMLVLGSAWNQNSEYVIDLMRTVREVKLTCAVLVHDIMYALFPHWVAPLLAGRFRANAESLLLGADRILSYSACTVRDVGAYCRQNRIDVPPLSMISLGDDGVRPDGSEEEEVTGSLAELLARPFVIYVSAVGVRKNHALLHQVWTRLVDEFGEKTPHLLCVGRIFPEMMEMCDRVSRDPRMRGRIHFLTSIDDVKLSWLYRKCLFTVFPSLYEGWGLPVSESLAYGKICIAGDAGAVPEIAPELVDLIDPYDFAAWWERIAFYIRDTRARESRETLIRTRYKARDWSSAAASILAAVSDMTARTGEQGIPLLPLAQQVLINADGATRILRNGWHQPEAWGVWSNGAEARMTCATEPYPRRTLRLAAVTRTLLSEAHPRQNVSVTVNGEVAALWSFSHPAAARGEREVIIPPDFLRQRSLMDIEFRVESPVSPAELGLSADTRQLGIGLESCTFTEVSASEDERFARICSVRVPLGKTLSFGQHHDTTVYLHEGWGTLAPWGVWSVAERASMQVVPFPLTIRDIALSMRFRCFVRPELPRQRIGIAVNGEPLETWEISFGTASVYDRRLRIPRTLLDRSEIAGIEITLPDSRSPRDIGLGDDPRRLGIGLMRIQFEEV